LLAGNRLADPLAHLASAAATLGALTTGPEDIDRTAGAGAYGSFDIAFPDSPAVADIHGRFDGLPAVATYSQTEDKRHSQLGQAP
jgi:hypothetical protein